MGKIGKPQKKKKNKIKTYGWYKNHDKVNMAPKSLEQEVPRRLRELGIAIKEVKSLNSKERRNRNKFNNKSDGPNPNNPVRPNSKKLRKEMKMAKIPTPVEEPGAKKMGKTRKKITEETTESYFENLKPTRPLLENFQFKQKASESDKQFMRRVDDETITMLHKSKVADRFETKDGDKIRVMVKKKLAAVKKDKKNEKLKEIMGPDEEYIQKEDKSKDVRDFDSFQDPVIFGEVAHAPPTLSVVPKKSTLQGQDRPGRRIPALKEAFAKKQPQPAPKIVQQQRQKGETMKRKNMTLHQQYESDVKRENFVDAYRQMKKKKRLN